MKRFLGFLAIAGLIMILFMIAYVADSRYGSGAKRSPVEDMTLRAGYAREKITPPLGTPMTGFGNRDWDPAGCKAVHDDLFARALYLNQGGREVLIMGFDLLFFSRDEADRFKGAIGRKLDLPPGAILFNTSHTHTGPKVGTWFYTPSDQYYLTKLETAILSAATKARDSAKEATLWAAAGNSDLPMSRRLKGKDGKIEFRPNPEGAVMRSLPVLMIKDKAEKPICLLFSIACHPSTVKGDERSYQISADYPGAAMAKLDAWLGAPASLFLQGAGGDAKASIIGKGEKEWRAGSWDDVDAAGALVAEEVKALAAGRLEKIEPGLAHESIPMNWPLMKPLDRLGLEAVLKAPKTNEESNPEIMKFWAKEQIGFLERGIPIPSTVEITLHGIRLGDGLRIVGIEGEAVAEIGMLMDKAYRRGVTFALGYTDGAQMYLPTTPMLSEGGYEVESFWEYRQPASLAGGMEKILTESIGMLQRAGID